MFQRVAQASADVMPSRSREELLRKAGYSVSTFQSADEFVRGCAREEFDLLVIGDSFEYFAREQARDTFRELNPGAVVIQLIEPGSSATGYDNRVASADYTFEVTRGPEALLSFVAEILGRSDAQARQTAT